MPLVYAVETADDALLDRAQRTNPHGYVLKPADPRQLGLTLRAALNVAAQQRADRERHERTMAEIPPRRSSVESFAADFFDMQDRITAELTGALGNLAGHETGRREPESRAARGPGRPLPGRA